MNRQRTDDFPEPAASRSADPPVRFASAEPRIFGLVPPALALVLGLAGLVVGIIMLASGAVIAAIVWSAAGIALLALAIDASRRWPASALPRLAVRVADGAGRNLGLARVTAGAWGEASRRVVSLRHELRSLRSEREARLSTLGAAAYRDDADQVREQRQRLAEIDARIGTCERERDEVVADARERIQKERAAAQPTEAFAIPEEPPPLDEHEKTRTAPTARRRTPPVRRA
jgi:hypothetical protein